MGYDLNLYSVFFINNNLFVWNNIEINLGRSSIWQGSIPTLSPNSDRTLSCTNYTKLIDIDSDYAFPNAGVTIVTTTNKIISTLFRQSTSENFISQWDYPSGNNQLLINISSVFNNDNDVEGIYVYNNTFYLIDTQNIVYSISSSPPYTITNYGVITNTELDIRDASQSSTCININFSS